MDARHLRAVLRANNGNVAATARALAIPRRTLDRRINDLNLRAWLTEKYPRSKRQPKR